MEERKKVILAGMIFIVLVAIAIGVYYFFKAKEAPSVEDVSEEPSAQVALEESVRGKEKGISEFLEVELDKSDETVRRLAKELSSHPKLSGLLMSKSLIRTFTAAVDNIANGLSPRPQIDFFSPRGSFDVVKRNGRYYVNPENYNRYDQVADVFLSLDTKGSVDLYRQVKPLIQEAYRDLGYPEENFDRTLLRAIVELLKVPLVEGDLLLEKKVVTYMLSDSKLEKLSEAQKHLLRMGPENVRIIQEKLREMAVALGFSEERLPSPQVY